MVPTLTESEQCSVFFLPASDAILRSFLDFFSASFLLVKLLAGTLSGVSRQFYAKIY